MEDPNLLKIRFPILNHYDIVKFKNGYKVGIGKVVKKLFPGYNCKWTGKGRMRYILQDLKDKSTNYIIYEDQILRSKEEIQEFEQSSMHIKNACRSSR